MRAFAITIKDHPMSEHGFDNLKVSSERVGNDFEIEKFDAVTPTTIFDHRVPTWTYPMEGTEQHLTTGLILSAYSTVNHYSRLSCFMSHYLLWKRCVELDESILILEHDAYFIKKLAILDLTERKIIGINDPRGATRKSQLYHNIIQEHAHGKKLAKTITDETRTIPVPRIDDERVPQGLAGNSAYVMSPDGARDALRQVKRLGAWPNDALLCYQLFSYLAVTTTYFTKVQGMPSTTSL